MTAPDIPRTVVADTLSACPLCHSAGRDAVLSLPAFPLTGIYVSDPGTSLPKPDQELMLCRDCGHGYLASVIDPVLLYQDTYTHRTGGSSIARAGNDFLWAFIQSVAAGRRFASALEIGCNDLYMIGKLQGIARAVVGLDPIWKNAEPAVEWPHVRVMGKFVSELDCTADLDEPPDLVVSAHTFEHIADPFDQLRPVVGAARPGALFFIEVPSLDTQLDNFRFDQVFHQHIQYFSLASIQGMIERLGCQLLTHRLNHRYWGGTLMVAFTKRGGAGPLHARRPSAADARERVEIFRRRYAVLGQELAAFDGPLYAFGAAQMLPTVAYHLPDGIRGFKAILDDNESRIGMFFPEEPSPIQSPAAASDMADAGVMITALDSYRPILRRLLDMDPRTIFYPLCKL